MESSSPTEAELQTRIRQQQVVADLGQQALETDDLDQLMHDATVAVADALDNEYCKVLELLSGGDEVLLRQGVGWRDGLVGSATVPTDLDSQAGYTLVSKEPVIVDDLGTEERFSGPELLTSHDVVSGISVVIGSPEDPWGVLGTHTTERRSFTEHDADFVQSVANVLASAVENERTRRELERSERRYRGLVENFPNGSVGLFDEDLEYVAVGGQLLDTLDLEPEDRIGRPIHDLHSEDLLEEIEPYFRAALSGESNSFEVEYRGRHLSANVLPVGDGEVEAGMLVVQDVTERREAQRDLRESEAKFRLLAENLDEIVWMASADAEEFVYVNPAFEDVWRLDREALYDEPLTFLDLVHEADRERVRRKFTALPDEEFDEEFRIVRPDGEVRWIHARGAIADDEAGEITRVVGIGEDVTGRVERERELERALDLLEKTERIADVGGWEIDTETEEVFWTEHIFDLLDVDAEEEPPLDEALDMYHDADQPIVEEAVEEALAAGDSFDVEVRLITDAGDLRWLRLQGAAETVDGEVVSLRGAAQDVTDRKQREERLRELIGRLEESNERLEQFAYAASHDLQEPLRMVSSYLQLVEQRYGDELDDDGVEFIEFAVDGAERMREMIEALLAYSRVETRGDPLAPVDLEDVLADTIDDLQVRIEERDAEVTVDSLPTVEGDEGQLRQVFQNLLSNAIEYSGDEPPRVHVSAERREVRRVAGRSSAERPPACSSERGPREDSPAPENRDSEWVIAVADEGIGIDPDDQDRIFEVFQRLHSREEHHGTGIGLALCERIVERHGGDVWVESEPGEGSTFYLTLPPASEGDDE